MKQNLLSSLKQKAEQIQCSDHKQPIISLNIDQNVKQGERLICQGCSSLGSSIIFMEHVEGYLNKWQQQELEAISKEEERFDQLTKSIQKLLEQLQKQFSTQIKLVTQELFVHSENFKKLIKQQSQLSSIINDLSKETIGASILQNVAAFLSKQNIVKGKLELKEKFELPIEYKKSIDDSLQKLTAQLNKFNLSIQQISIKREPLIIQKQVQIDLNNLKYKDPIQLDGHNDKIVAVAISNDDRLMASGGNDKKIILWDLDKKSIKFEFDGQACIQDLAFSYDNKWLAGAQFGYPRNILLFDTNNLKKEPSKILKGHERILWRIVFTMNSKFLISGSQDKTMRIWKVDQSKCIVKKELSNWVNSVSISQNEKFMSAGCWDGLAYLFDCSNIEDVKDLVQWQADYQILCTIFTPDSKNVLTGRKQIKFWSIEQLLSKNENKTPYKVIECDDVIWSICLRMNGSILISNDGQIKIWNTENDKLINTLTVPERFDSYQDQNFAVTSDLKHIITGGENKKLKVYELISN